uniref:Uncharacterized protein n=1 Tax=Nelumbo nucifera TaxID=4432 RepID=A0A822XXL1_NELNU|nr:TPA_asm: hypothetical protein HUJ06_027842 [Nelumbo nucifera]
MGAGTKKKVQRKFKIRGYTLQIDALEEILFFSCRFEDAEDEAFDLLINKIKK